MYQSFNILVAEDEPADIALLKRAFLKSGINAPVEFVRDGQEALDYLQGKGNYMDRNNHPLPKLLLLDLKMPRLNGFDVLKWIREHAGIRRLPVVVLTSSNLQEDIHQAYDLGANSYLLKTSDLTEMETLAKTVEHYWLRSNQCPDLQTN
jgi:CheY-like chemotaxis protein